MTDVSNTDLQKLLMQARDVRRGLPGHAGPTPESIARHELTLCERDLGTPEPVERVIRLADTWTEIAAQYLGGMAAALAAPGDSITLSLLPLCRSAMEHSAAVQWVLDPTVDAEQRMARAAVLSDLANETAITAASHAPDMPGREDLVASLRAEKKAERARIASQFPNGTSFQTNKKGDKIQVGGVERPRPTELASRLSGSEDDSSWLGAYDYLSSAVHPSLLLLEHAQASPAGGGWIGLDDDFMSRIVQAAIAPYHEALGRFIAYMGWSDQARQKLFDRIVVVLNSEDE